MRRDLVWMDIPSGWKTDRARYIFRQMNRPIRIEDEIITAFRDGTVTLRSNRRTEGFTNSIKEIGYQGIRKGDLIIHAMDGFAGAIGVSDSDGKSTPVYSVCQPIIPANNYYYAYLIRFLALNGYIESLARGIRERSTEFRFKEFREIDLPIPPLPEQQAIADFLDRHTTRIDALIAKYRRLLELLDEKRAALINQVVTRGLNPDVKMKDSGVAWLGEIPEHWEVKKLKHISLKIGSGKTPRGGSEIYSDEGVLFIRCQNVHFDGLHLDDVVYISSQIDQEMQSTRVYPQDVLLNITGASLGRATIVPLNFPSANVNQHVAIIRSKKNKIFTRYLNRVMSSQVVQSQIFSTENGAAREGLPYSKISNLIFSLPITQDEQEKISNYLDIETSKIDCSKIKINNMITKLQEYRTVLISAAVTGKIDVRTQEG